MHTYEKPQGYRSGRPGAIKVICCGICILTLICASGCSTPEERVQELYDAGQSEKAYKLSRKIAEKLLAEGRYEEVYPKYSYTPEGNRAAEKIAERLFAEGDYVQIVNRFSFTRLADMARDSLAMMLYREGEYHELLTACPNTEVANMARDSLGGALYRNGKYRELLVVYPNTKAARRVDSLHPEVRRAMKRDEEARQREEERNREIARKRNYEEARKRWDNCRYNPSSCLEIGMSYLDVSHQMGPPDDKNTTTFMVLGERHTREQWVYELYDYKRVYVYIEDYVLTGWQE